MANRRTGTRPRLSRDAIVASAVSLADTEGLDAVTIRRLAQEHGVTPMAMYWHFNDKDALLDGIAEYLIDAVKLPEPGAGTWDEQLRQVLEAFLAAIRPHPGVAGLSLRRIFAAESGLALAEHALSLLEAGGFAPARAAQVGRYLLCAVITLVTSDPNPQCGADVEAREEILRHKRAALEVLSPTRYPRVVAAAPSLVGCDDPDEYFALNIDLLVQGTRGVPRS
ncbi:TetR/AcrR family transcriptional regulator [Krasilnikovia sp. MM14-A1259]|uniref:TetR/AcrR family transcriptional regulator n=1 Tax=Krasilnikovia sp. MM14-A1259 TaxID=3373539 RepID=UPI00380AFD41